jgi:acyl carrier protein
MEATELVMAFEEVFDIEIPDEDAKSFTTIKSIADYIVKKASDNNTPDSF